MNFIYALNDSLDPIILTGVEQSIPITTIVSNYGGWTISNDNKIVCPKDGWYEIQYSIRFSIGSAIDYGMPISVFSQALINSKSVIGSGMVTTYPRIQEIYEQYESTHSKSIPIFINKDDILTISVAARNSYTTTLISNNSFSQPHYLHSLVIKEL